MPFEEIYRYRIVGRDEEIVILVEDASPEEVEEMRKIAMQVKAKRGEWKLTTIAKAIRKRFPNAKIYYKRIFF